MPLPAALPWIAMLLPSVISLGMNLWQNHQMSSYAQEQGKETMAAMGPAVQSATEQTNAAQQMAFASAGMDMSALQSGGASFPPGILPGYNSAAVRNSA